MKLSAEDKRLGLHVGDEGLHIRDQALLDRGDLYEYQRCGVDTNEKCRACEVRYLCGGACRAWAKDRENPNSGDFDCASRKNYYLRLARKIEEE